MDKNSLGFVLLRVGVIFLFVWFGSMQIADPKMWVRLIPDSVVAMTGISAHNLVLINGTCEIVGSIFLAFGIWVPFISLLLSLHIVSIVFVVGLSPVGARDIALAVAVLAFGLLSRKTNA